MLFPETRFEEHDIYIYIYIYIYILKSDSHNYTMLLNIEYSNGLPT